MTLYVHSAISEIIIETEYFLITVSERWSDMKNLAIIGSSGGNLYNQGGSDPAKMMDEIITQAKAAEIKVSYLQFVGTNASMDGISPDAKARLWTMEGDNVVSSDEGTLKDINHLATEKDDELSKLILDGKIDGIMLLSCDPTGINNKALVAAAEKHIPVAGTGGTSMANTQSLGCNVIAASGTTGTTNKTRAISAITAFSKEWGIKYRPILGRSNTPNMQEGNVWKRVNFRGIMMASMPGFISMALCLALSKIPGLGNLESVFETLVGYLPIVLAAIAARQVSGLDEVGIVAGIIAGALAVDGGIIGGLIVGILAGVLAYYLILVCFKYNVPGTTANITAGGLSGLIAGLVGMMLIAPITAWAGNAIKLAIDWALDYNPVLAGGLAGFAIWFAILGGVYHAAILPIILLEMESTGFSFLGAIDLCGLIMVTAGLNLANIVFPKQKSDRIACIPNLIINLAFGTFAEASYPFMFADKKVFGAVICSATLSGILIGFLNVKCTAYVPFFVAPLMSNGAIKAIICILFSMAITFILVSICNKSSKNNQRV